MSSGELWGLEVVVRLQGESGPLMSVEGPLAPQLKVALVSKDGEPWSQQFPFPVAFCRAGESQPMILPILLPKLPGGEYWVRVEIVQAGQRVPGVEALVIKSLRIQ